MIDVDCVKPVKGVNAINPIKTAKQQLGKCRLGFIDCSGLGEVGCRDLREDRIVFGN